MPSSARIEREAETFEASDEMIFDGDRAILSDIGGEFVFVSHALHQCTGPAVYEALCQAFVEGVGETIFYRACAFLPVCGVFQPVRPIGNKRPRANVCDPRRERIYIPICPVCQSHLLGKPVFRNTARSLRHVLVKRPDQLVMALAGNLAVVWDLADIPQFCNRCRR